MIKVLFVCLGNICRSPLAEAIFIKKVKDRHLDHLISADSAGTANYHIGENPDHRSIDVAQNHGVPISHKGKQYKYGHATEFDYILAMDAHNHRDIIHISANRPEGLFLMRHFDAQDRDGNVPDPYYGGMEDFEEVYQILDRSLDEFLDFVIKEQKF